MKQLARPPRPSRAFQDLKSTVASDLSVDQYDKIIEAAYLQEGNLELLEDISRIGQAKQGPGPPRAGSSKVVTVAKEDSGGFAFYQPSQGEVWLLEEMTAIAVTSGSWTMSLELAVGAESMTIIPTQSKTDTFLLFTQAFGWPSSATYLDSNTKMNMALGGSFTSVSIFALMTRYR